MSLDIDLDPIRPGIPLGLLEDQENPFPVYERLLQDHPVCQLEPDGIWAVSRYDDVRFALERPNLFLSSGLMAAMQPDWLHEDCRDRDLFIIMQDPPDHTKYRALLNRAFASKMIQALIPLMHETAQGLVKKIRPDEQFDFQKDFAYAYVHKIIGHITGIEEGQSQEEVSRWLEVIGKLSPEKPDEHYIREFGELHRAQKEHFNNIIRDRREHPREDLVSALVHAEVDGEQLTDHMLRNALDLLLSAGYHTTLQMLCHSMIRLSQQPDLRQTLSANPQQIPAFIEEALRLESIAPALFRQTTEDIELSGVRIPRGATILLLLAAANRDPRQFPNPTEFQMGRPNIKMHLAFGHGPHTCLGAALARQEIKIALETILAAFHGISCPVDHELSWSKSVLLRSVNALPTVFTNDGFTNGGADKSLSAH